MGWYKVTLKDTNAASDDHVRLLQEYHNYHAAHNHPEDALLFTNKNEGTSEYFFSPRAAEIAMPIVVLFKGSPCPEPSQDEITLYSEGSL